MCVCVFAMGFSTGLAAFYAVKQSSDSWWCILAILFFPTDKHLTSCVQNQIYLLQLKDP